MLTVSQVKEIIKKNIMSDPKDRVEICILGAPGIGKSSIVFQVARELNKTITLFSATTKTREDVAGIPVYNFANIVKGIVNKTEIKNEVIHTRPSYMDTDILFIDEITNCSEHEFKWIAQMITERRVGEHQLNPNTYIVCAGNRPEHSELANDLPAIFASRLAILDVTVDKKDVIKYAYDNSFDPRVIAYIDQNSNILENIKYKSPNEGYACPRSLEKVSKILKMFGGKDEEYIQNELIIGALGRADGTEFLAYMKNISNKIPYKDLEEAFKEADKNIVKRFNSLDLDSKIANVYDVYSLVKKVAKKKDELATEDINTLFMSVYVTANENTDNKISTLYCSLLETDNANLTMIYNALINVINKDKEYTKKVGMTSEEFIGLYDKQYKNILKIRKHNS